MSPLTRDDLRAFRASLGLSQVRLAEALGVSRRNVEDWESEISAPPVYLALALAALNANLEPWKPTSKGGE